MERLSTSKKLEDLHEHNADNEPMFSLTMEKGIAARKADATDCIYAALECLETLTGKYSIKRKKFEKILTYAVAPLCSLLVPLSVDDPESEEAPPVNPSSSPKISPKSKRLPRSTTTLNSVVLRGTPALSFLKHFVQLDATREALAYVEKVCQYGKVTANGIIYKDTDNNNTAVTVPADILKYMQEVDSNTICFITHVIRNSVNDAGARISFFATRVVERMIFLMERTTHDMNLPKAEDATTAVEANDDDDQKKEKKKKEIPEEEKDLDIENVVINTSKALTYLAAFPEMRDEIKKFGGVKIFLSHFDDQQTAHMKAVKRENKRKDAWDHTTAICKKLKMKIAENEERIFALESEVDYEKIDEKEELKIKTEQIKKDLRVASKRDEDVKSKYDVAAAILDVSCEKVNAFLVGLCLLCDCDEENQELIVNVMNEAGKDDDFNGITTVSNSAATESLLMHMALEDPEEQILLAPLKQLIDRGGRRTEWATLHLVGSLCRDKRKAISGRRTNKKVQETMNKSEVLKSVLEKFVGLVKEDGNPDEGGYGLGEWRHAAEVLYWLLKDNPEGVVIAREYGLVPWLLQLVACELPFAEYTQKETEGVEGDEVEGDGDSDYNGDEKEKENERKAGEGGDLFIPIVEYYACPANHHSDPLVDGESIHYYYCSSCRVPEPCKRQLRGKWKESSDDGAIFASHVLAVMLELDFECHEICLNQVIELGLVNGMKLGSSIKEQHQNELAATVVSYVWGCDVGDEIEGGEGGEEAGALIDNYFEDGGGSMSTMTTGTKEEKKGEAEDDDDTPPAPPAAPPLPKKVPAISVIVAVLNDRLTKKCWCSAAGVAKLLAALSLKAPYWADRHPSKVTSHKHLCIQETGDLTFEICQAIVASGGDEAVARGLGFVAKGGKKLRTDFISATGPDGEAILALLCKCVGRICLSHENLRNDIVKHVVKDRTSASSIPGSRAGGTAGSVGGGSRTASRAGGGPQSTAGAKANSFELCWKVLIEAMINGVRSFTGQGMDGLGVEHNSGEIRNCDLNIKIEATGCLASLCYGHGPSAQSFGEVGIKALKALCSHANKNAPPELQVQACRCIYSTAVLKVVKQRLAIECKVLAMLLLLLHSDDADVVIYSLAAIERVCTNCHPGQQFIAQYKGLLPFVRITSGNWGPGIDGNTYFSSANAAACKAVTAIVCRHTENRHLAHNVKLIPHLVNILLKGDGEEKKSVAKSFSELLKHNTENRDAMVSFGGVEALTVIARLGDDFLKSTAALEMKIVCANSDMMTTELTKVGGVPPLISMINSTDMLLQRHASQAISGLVMNPAFLDEIVAGGGIQSLVTMLVSNDDETATYACITLGRCAARNQEARKIAEDMGALKILFQMAAGSREIGKAPEGIKFMDGGEHAGESRAFEEEPEDKMGFGFNLSAARGSGLGDELCNALRCTREAAIAIGNFATDEEQFILDGSSNFKDGRRVSGMLPRGLLRQAPNTHQPSSDYSHVEIEEEFEEDYEQVYDEVLGTNVRRKKAETEQYVPEIAKRLARRTEADRKSAMSAYIERQEQLRLQLVRGKELHEESSEEESSEEEYDSEEEEGEGGESLDARVREGDLIV
ncbi:hypothetical protein TrVE_jg13990 [Triparma verrucosa]|uniref:Uncharacterized protein n=1 Tax=Triparma verrucosa TaxID=1606542 RepID=A0A9W7FGW6_9STRA|nr:hypothetical protein TrVE_jg13990 [Triparma verrucosa]